MLPSSPTTDLIMFAIQSGISLGGTVKKSYIDSLKSKAISLPLPNFPTEIDESVAHDYFQGSGGVYLKDLQKVKGIFMRYDRGENLSDDDKHFYIENYLHLKNAHRHAEINLSKQDVTAFLQIRQWQNADEPHVGVLQAVSGSVIEIAVGYFANTPGAVDDRSAKGKAVKNFLASIDKIDFTEGDLKKTVLKGVVPELFSTMLENTELMPVGLVSDPKMQALLGGFTKGMAEDLYGRIVDNQADEAYLKSLGKQVLGSFVTHAGGTVLQNFQTGLGLNATQSDFMKSTGGALMDIITKGDGGMDLKNVFSSDSIDKIIKASLTALAEHPETLGKNDAIRNIISGVASAVGKSQGKIIGGAMIPELSRLILEKTALNLSAIWDVEDTDPKKHLLLTCTQELLAIVSAPPRAGKWKPVLSQSQIMDVAGMVFDEVTENPEWITSKINDKSVMGELVTLVFEGMESIPKEKRLHQSTIKTLLKESVKAVALRKNLLAFIVVGGEGGQKKALSYALESLFAMLYGHKDSSEANWTLAKTDVANMIVEYYLSKIAKEALSLDLIHKALDEIRKVAENLESNGSFSKDEFLLRLLMK